MEGNTLTDFQRIIKVRELSRYELVKIDCIINRLTTGLMQLSTNYSIIKKLYVQSRSLYIHSVEIIAKYSLMEFKADVIDINK